MSDYERNSTCDQDMINHSGETKDAPSLWSIVFNSARDAISVINVVDFSIVEVNDAFLKGYGLSRERVVGRACYEVTHHLTEPCTGADHVCPLQGVMASGGHYITEHTHYDNAGERFYAEVSASPIRDQRGRIVRAVHVSRDITDRKRKEQEIRDLSLRLIEAYEKAHREIGHSLHDEVGGSLVVLKLAIIQARKELGEYSPAALEEIECMVDDLTDQVRNISHSMHPVMLDMCGLREALQGHFIRHQRRTGIRINFTHSSLEGRFPSQTEAVAFRIVQEALTNASKHSGARAIDVALSCDNGSLTMSVKDDGCGFDPSRMHMGIGIRGMKDLATLAGGSLNIESAPQKGTVVRCELPVNLRE